MRFIIDDRFRVKPSKRKSQSLANQEASEKDSKPFKDKPKVAWMMRDYCLERGYPVTAYARAASYLKKTGT